VFCAPLFDHNSSLGARFRIVWSCKQDGARLLLRQVGVIVSGRIILVGAFKADAVSHRGLQRRHIFRVPPGMFHQIVRGSGDGESREQQPEPTHASARG
jgi:hypothetical protein